MTNQDVTASLAARLAENIRGKLIEGEFKPGQQLAEATLAAKLDVSRNSLREAFRILTKDGLLRHEANRGVFVAIPSMASIIDIYRVRRMIECSALEEAQPKHPAISRMRQAVDRALACREREDWMGVGSANMAFHAAIVDMANSARLNAFYEQIAAELRLSFGLVDDPAFLHAPYLDRNREILELIEAGRQNEAVLALRSYLDRSERTLLSAFERSSEGQS